MCGLQTVAVYSKWDRTNDYFVCSEPEQETEVVKQAREFELQGVQAAEQGNVEEALTYFEKAIGVAPERPSGYNNRAQALRLNGNVQGEIISLITLLIKYKYR